jgi:hypothetical protein
MDQSNSESIVYRCAECDAPVFLIDQVPQKKCDHTDAPVVAQLSAVVRGTGAVA